MTQKKKTDFKIVTPPDDLSEVRAKTKKIHREKLKKIVVPVILIALAVSGTYLMLTNKAYSEAGTASGTRQIVRIQVIMPILQMESCDTIGMALFF